MEARKRVSGSSCGGGVDGKERREKKGFQSRRGSFEPRIIYQAAMGRKINSILTGFFFSE